MPWGVAHPRLSGRLRADPHYRIRSEFSTPIPNPLPNPLVLEPGPGSLTRQDLDAQMSVNFGALVWAGGSGAWDRTYLYSQAGLTRREGRTLEFSLTPITTDYMRLGFQRASNGLIADNEAMIYFGGGGFINVVDGLDAVSPLYPYVTLSTRYLCRVVDAGDGFHFYVSEYPSTTWTLIWRKSYSQGRLFQLYPCIQALNMQATMLLFRVFDGRLKPPQLWQRQLLTSERYLGAADGITEVRATAAAGDMADLIYRYTDANNFWRARFDGPASFFRLQKVVAGVTTTVASTALGLISGQNLLIKAVHFGSYHRLFLGSTSGPTGTSADLATATGCGVGAVGTYTDLRVDTGGALYP